MEWALQNKNARQYEHDLQKPPFGMNIDFQNDLTKCSFQKLSWRIDRKVPNKLPCSHSNHFIYSFQIALVTVDYIPRLLQGWNRGHSRFCSCLSHEWDVSLHNVCTNTEYYDLFSLDYCVIRYCGPQYSLQFFQEVGTVFHGRPVIHSISSRLKNKGVSHVNETCTAKHFACGCLSVPLSWMWANTGSGKCYKFPWRCQL